MNTRNRFIKFSNLLFILLILFSTEILAQEYDALVALDGYKTKVYFSPGNDERAKIVAARMNNVLDFYNEIIDFEPDVTMLILNPVDWPKFTDFPVYGMAHYMGNKTLVIASENNEFWDSFIPPLDQLPVKLADKIKSVYVDENGNLTMQPFFDLLAIHELGHAYHFQAGLNMQRKWMGELFCNILLHTYIAEKEPEQLPALTIFPQMVIAGGREGYKYTQLNDIEERYDEIGQQHPQNYGWFQCRWHSSAADIYDDGGIATFVKLWKALSEQKDKLDDEKFAEFLSNEVHQSVADVMLKWNE